jgi:hypothetical protein
MGKQPDEDTDEDKSTESDDAEDSSSEDQHVDKENHHGEGHGNLKRRSDWFQKRHGGG